MDMFIDCDLLRKEIVINRGSEPGKNAHSPYTVTSIQETVAVGPHEALVSELQAFAATCYKPENVDVPGVVADMAAMRVCFQIQKAIQK